MNKEILTFGCIEMEKCEYCKVITRYITRFLEKKGYKYFIDYKDEEEVTPWCFMLHKLVCMQEIFAETIYLFWQKMLNC